MKQLTQKLSNGEMLVQDVPPPILRKGMVLVKNHFSLISAGTEGSTAQTARKSLIGKAKERPQQVKQVLEVFAQQGPLQTYRAIVKKLEAYSPLGYSCAGEVIGLGEEVSTFNIEDKVACAGIGYANHAEIVAVPVNLCVKLNKSADLKKAAYNTLGAIALQGVRQADLRLGETCVVIGLGLLGQLTCLMLKASGIRVIGIDINSTPVEIALNHCADIAFTRDTPGIEEQIFQFTNGLGADAAIISAATSSTDPINFAGAILRKKGIVVILGAVPTGFDRDPYWYKKELELRMSCSYGPGRYDLNYEEKGIDYPAPYVRWTEKRNMEAFQQLLFEDKIIIDYLTTHEFNFQDSPKAYNMIVKKKEPYLGIILKYDLQTLLFENGKLIITRPKPVEKINLAFIGAGSYAQGNLLPNIPRKNKNITRKGIMTNTGTTSKRVAERFGFEYCTSNEDDILKNDEINTVFIATHHDSHAEYLIKSLKNQKHVFVEKPLCLNEPELEQITNVKLSNENLQLLVGFNRRFSSLSEILKKHIDNGPMTMIYRVNGGKIPGDSWIQDIKTGGGRIIGEACHFIDYLTWLNGSIPIIVYATSLTDAENKNDTVNIHLTFANGSTGIIAYYANGPKTLPKEYIEVFHSGTAGIVNDFKELKIFGKKIFKKKLFNQDKGQLQMVERFFNSIITANILIPFNEIVAVTRTSFAILESLKTGLPVKINSSHNHK
jgi:predicted dehydrogenase/threonine dehydrogenase-like Zn-dependent dehydrogenase